MIVPSKNQKTYGVLHTENYFSFLGFCKKVNSDEIQKVDIYLDDVLIDTIIADKHLQKIEDIYELDGFGFNYDLPEEYVGQKSFISFKNHESQENLQNSPYVLIDKDNNKFNEAKFLYSLSQPSYEEKIKNIYCPNSIGFLATDINLNDQCFMNFIYNLKARFPSAEFVGLTYKSTVEIDNINNIKIEPITSLIDLVTKCSIFISNRYQNYDNKTLLIEKVLAKSDFVNTIVFDERLSIMNLESFDNLIKSAPYDPICDDYLELGLSQNYNRSTIKTIYKEILHIDTLNFKEIYIPQYYGDIIEGILNSKDVRLIFNKIWKLYVKNIFN